MEHPIHARVRAANVKIRTILSRARNALAGRQDFTAENIQEISQPLTEMAPIVSQATDLRAVDPRLDVDLKEYAENLGDLQNTLEHVRFMLLARQTHMEASRSHLETVNLWATTFKQTR
jgi:signal transduction histidine kinase